MTKSDVVNLPVESSTELTEQKFQQMDLKELGLQPADFQEVLAARKELQNMSHNSGRIWQKYSHQNFKLYR